MAMYKHARTRIRSYGGSVSEWFGVNVGVHQDSVLSPLLFIIVMEAVTHSVRERVYHGKCYMLMTWYL